MMNLMLSLRFHVFSEKMYEKNGRFEIRNTCYTYVKQKKKAFYIFSNENSDFFIVMYECLNFMLKVIMYCLFVNLVLEIILIYLFFLHARILTFIICSLLFTSLI